MPPSKSPTISIWDIFGTGRTLRQPRAAEKQPVVKASSKPRSAKAEAPKQEESAAKPSSIKAETGAAEAPKEDTVANNSGFTEEEDKELIRLKQEENKTWNEIATKLGKTKKQITVRWSEIRPKNDNAGGNQDQQNGWKQNGGNQNGGNHNGGKQKGGKQKGGGGKGKKGAAAEATQGGEIQSAEDRLFGILPGEPDIGEMEEDAVFNADELTLLVNLLHRERNDIWTRVAGVFYDCTGRRVHPLDVQEKLTGQR